MRASVLALLFVLSLAARARADAADGGAAPPVEVAAAVPVTPPVAVPPTDQGAPTPLVTPPPPQDAPTMWIDRNMSKSWELGGPRPFFATMVDIGYLYARPRVQLGYGKPFHKWIGIEANPSISSNSTGGYAGMRLDLPNFDIRVGARQTYSFQRSYLLPKVEYDRYDLESTALPRTNLTTLETEANFSIPVGPGAIIGLASVSYVANVPKGQLVYEETLRVLVQPPWVVRGRVGYMFGFGEHNQASIGPAVDVLDIPERRSHVVRAGVLARFVLSRSFEIRGTFMPRVLSQDELGLLESDFTELGLRWRWATASP
jgi:hypothetical protein